MTSHPRRNHTPVEEFLLPLNLVRGGRTDELVRRSRGLPRVLLAEGLLRSLDIPEDAPGGETLNHAFSYLKTAALAEGGYFGLSDPLGAYANLAAMLGGEALACWRFQLGDRRLHPALGERNNPVTVIEAALAFVAAKQTDAEHA